MLIEVTQNDIDMGMRGAARKCPIARAIERITDERYKATVWVEPRLIHAGLGYVGLPGKAMEFIERFDKGEPVAPFAFDADLEDLIPQGDAHIEE